MTESYLCISIPIELQKFRRTVILEDEIQTVHSSDNFGVKMIKNDLGVVTGTAYYSESGELIKRIYYKGSAVSLIEHYRNNILYSKERYDKGVILQKTLYSKNEQIASVISYKYNRNNQITCIQKTVNKQKYSVEYEYDELMRVNGRILKVNNKIINEQYYKYDILDRIIEYHDSNQYIRVHKVNQNNELVSYTIQDVIGNIITVNNKYMCSEYIGTDIELNEHKTTVNDRSYVNNIMLKKPFTSEDDLDFALANLINVPKVGSADTFKTHREQHFNKDDLSNYIIMNKKKEFPPPISADKIKCLNL